MYLVSRQQDSAGSWGAWDWSVKPVWKVTVHVLGLFLLDVTHRCVVGSTDVLFIPKSPCRSWCKVT